MKKIREEYWYWEKQVRFVNTITDKVIPLVLAGIMMITELILTVYGYINESNIILSVIIGYCVTTIIAIFFAYLFKSSEDITFKEFEKAKEAYFKARGKN